MALQQIPGGIAIVGSQVPGLTSAATFNMNAAGKACSVIGEVFLEGGSGSKTLSAAGGGSIIWRTGATTTFVAGSTFRIGLQDVGTGGLEDGTYDVYGELVGGVDTISANTTYNTPMTSGTKTVNHGDTIAIVASVPTLDIAQFVIVSRVAADGEWASSGSGRFWGAQDSATKTNTALLACIVFDDGTTGWIIGTGGFLNGTSTAIAVDTSTTPDEICAAFTPTFRMEVSVIGLALGLIANGDTYEIILYEDPGGTPNALITLTPDEDFGSFGLGNLRCLYSITPTVLEPGIQYGIAVRPTSANSISYYCLDLTTEAEPAKAALPFGASSLVMGRSDQTGAFATIQTYYVPKFYLGISALDDGVSAGGGLKLVGTGGLAG